MDALKLITCLKDLYQEGYNNGMDYAGCLEFGCGKSELSLRKNKQLATQQSFRDLMGILEEYLNELLEHIESPHKSPYQNGVEMAYAALNRQWQIWKDMELKD